MKLDISVELDWIGDDGELDSETERVIINKIASKIEEKFLGESSKIVAAKANSIINAKVELLINTVMEKPVVVSDGWNDKEEYASIFDMVEEKLTNLYQEKVSQKTKCKEDPFMVQVRHAIEHNVNEMVRDIERKIKYAAKSEADNAIEKNSLIQALETIMEKDSE